MGLNVFAEVDPVTLFTGGNYPSTGGFIKGFGSDAQWYYDRLDFFAAKWQSGASSSNDYVRWDPLLLSNTGFLFDEVAEPDTIGTNADRIAVGQWDRAANEQRVYNYSSSASITDGFNEVQPLALNQVITPDVWPNVGHASHRGSLISTNPGFYDQAGNSMWIIFDHWGFAFNPTVRLRHTDAIQYTEVPVLVNLTTGAATLVAGLVTRFTGTPSQFQEPPLFGSEVEFDHCQFVPDDISTNSHPRGALHLFSTGADNPADTSMSRFWVQVVDWNPLNVVGTPSRVHLRRRLLTAYDVIKGAIGSFGGIFETGATIASIRTHYHPRTNRYFLYTGNGPQAQLDAGESKFMFISPTPTVATLTEPAPIQEVTTGKTIDFVTEALGSLAEKIGGVSLDFQLRRVSSIDEVLPVTFTPPGGPETVTVANDPISPTDPNLSPVVVKKNGTPMTEGGGASQYTVNRATGQITFNAPEPVSGNVYTATYRHFTVPVAPPHGTVLNLTAVTDLTGAAVCRIRYADVNPVPDWWDRLDSTEA